MMKKTTQIKPNNHTKRWKEKTGDEEYGKREHEETEKQQQIKSKESE